MKVEHIVSRKSREALMAAFQEQDIRFADGDDLGEIRFTGRRSLRNDTFRSSLSYVIEGTLRADPRGTDVGFRIRPGLSTILSLLVILGLLGWSGYHTLVLKSPSDAGGSPLFFGLLALTLVATVVLYFYRKKKIREDFLRLL